MPRVSVLPPPHAQLCCEGGHSSAPVPAAAALSCLQSLELQQEPGPPWSPEPQSPGNTGARAAPRGSPEWEQAAEAGPASGRAAFVSFEASDRGRSSRFVSNGKPQVQNSLCSVWPFVQKRCWVGVFLLLLFNFCLNMHISDF